MVAKQNRMHGGKRRGKKTENKVKQKMMRNEVRMDDSPEGETSLQGSTGWVSGGVGREWFTTSASFYILPSFIITVSLLSTVTHEDKHMTETVKTKMEYGALEDDKEVIWKAGVEWMKSKEAEMNLVMAKIKIKLNYKLVRLTPFLWFINHTCSLSGWIVVKCSFLIYKVNILL